MRIGKSMQEAKSCVSCLLMSSYPLHKIWTIIVIWPFDPLRAHDIFGPVYMNRFAIIPGFIIFRIYIVNKTGVNRHVTTGLVLL